MGSLAWSLGMSVEAQTKALERLREGAALDVLHFAKSRHLFVRASGRLARERYALVGDDRCLARVGFRHHEWVRLIAESWIWKERLEPPRLPLNLLRRVTYRGLMAFDETRDLVLLRAELPVHLLDSAKISIGWRCSVSLAKPIAWHQDLGSKGLRTTALKFASGARHGER